MDFPGKTSGVVPGDLGLGLAKGLNVEMTFGEVRGNFKVVRGQGQSKAEKAEGHFWNFAARNSVMESGVSGEQTESCGEIMRKEWITRSMEQGLVIAVEHAGKQGRITGAANLGSEMASDVIPSLSELVVKFHGP